MGDIDFFGYERSKVGTFLYSSDYASLYFSNLASTPGSSGSSSPAKAGLVQNATVAYQHNVQPRFEAGSAELYWISGQSLGNVQVGRLVGDKGILAGIQYGNDPNDLRKGILGNVEFKLGRQGLTGIFTSQEVLVMSGCVMNGINIAFGVGSFDVQEAFTIQAAMVKRGVVS